MSLSYLYDPNLQVQDKSGNNNVNGFLRVYIDNTDDRAVTYKDFNGTFNQADIRLDNNGRAVVIVDDTMTYRLEVYDRDGAMLWTQYPVKPSNTVINYGINNTYVMNADVRGTPDEIDVDSTTDTQTGFKTFFIKLSSTVKDFLSFVSNTLTSHGDAIGNLQTTVSNQGTAIGSLQNGKKDKQQPKSFNGSATKTVKKVAQNENGEFTVEFEDIDLPQEVPNVDIVSPNNTITVTSTTDPQTNTKTFEIDVANGGNSCGWFNSSNIDTVGNEESINVDRFRVSEGQSVIGNGLEFVPNSGDVESGVPFGKVYANAGIYFVSVRLNVLWTGNPVNKVCNVAGRQFDFSYNHEERVTTTKLVRLSARTKMSVDISLESDIPAGLRIWVEHFQIFAIGSGSGSGTTYAAGDGIDITNDVISTDIEVQNAQKINVNLDFGNTIQTVNTISTDGSTVRTDGFNFTLPTIKAGDGIEFTKVGTETTIAMDSEVGDVVETVEKLKKDLDTQITTNFDMPNISQVYDFADGNNWITHKGACMLYQSFTIPINHELRTTEDDADTPTLLGIYAQQNFAHKIMLALYEYTYAAEGEENGSSTYVGDTGPITILKGMNEFPLKNRNPSITELRSDKVYYASIYLPSTAFVNGLYLCGCPSYGNASIPAEPRLTCATENITWNGQELDMDDPTTTLNHYQVIQIPGQDPYYQYYIGPWVGGYNERWSTPRFYMQIRNGEYNVPVIPTAPFETLGDSKFPRGGILASDMPNFSASSENSGFRDVTPLTNVTITSFEWIDSMATARGWVAGNCVFSSDYSTNLSGSSNTVTDLGAQYTIDGRTAYAHRITFATPLALTAGVTYRFLCTSFISASDWIWSWTEPTDVFDASNNGWYVDWSQNVSRYSHIAGQYNKLYDNQNNHYVI